MLSVQRVHDGAQLHLGPVPEGGLVVNRSFLRQSRPRLPADRRVSRSTHAIVTMDRGLLWFRVEMGRNRCYVHHPVHGQYLSPGSTVRVGGGRIVRMAADCATTEEGVFTDLLFELVDYDSDADSVCTVHGA